MHSLTCKKKDGPGDVALESRNSTRERDHKVMDTSKTAQGPVVLATCSYELKESLLSFATQRSSLKIQADGQRQREREREREREKIELLYFEHPHLTDLSRAGMNNKYRKGTVWHSWDGRARPSCASFTIFRTKDSCERAQANAREHFRKF